MKIFVTRMIPQPGLDMLTKEFIVDINTSDRVLSKDEIIRALKGKDGLLCLLTDPIDKDVITAEPKLKMIASYAVGYDNIDVAAATKRGIPVSNTPGVLTETTAELAWALLFSVSRRIVEADKFTRSGQFKGWAPMLMLGQDVSQKTLGVIGTGRIGTAFALKSKGFNMNVLYTDEQPNRELEQQLGARRVPLQTLLKESDFISVHVPLTRETFHLIDEKELRLMKNTAVLINTARGPIIHEKALVKALSEQWIFGAGLDVYEEEPHLSEGLKGLDNVVLQPHTGSGTIETRTKMALMAAENMIIGLKGGVPPNCINKEVFKKKTIT
ncbi:MAG: D-glycerate dehydrogenase [Candidatus Thermoplasmatota archaeon]|jgi:lactate dehydrogenase-like 2-hydroxyacid dehydrogenase|nr:D-glycerate dehydrogenase [Candidatus Thermoplasmatota archaeon]